MARDLFDNIVKHALLLEEGVKEYQLNLIIYDVEDKRIVQWIK